MKYIAQLIFLLLISSCSSDLDEKVKSLVESKNKWIKSVPNRNYTYTYLNKCFCGLNDKEIQVQVENGAVISVTLKNGEKRKVKYFKTIKQHFEFILETIKKEEWGNSGSLNVEYDKILGYPSLINFRNKKVMDGSFTILISNITIQ